MSVTQTGTVTRMLGGGARAPHTEQKKKKEKNDIMTTKIRTYRLNFGYLYGYNKDKLKYITFRIYVLVSPL